MTCRICGASGEFPAYPAREMMFGSREAFDYFRCPSCGSLQIAAIPADLSRHYPPAYYSLQALRLDAPSRLRRWRLGSYLAGAHLEPLWSLLFGRRDWFAWLKLAGARPKDRVLDIGAGSGSFLRELWDFGFRDLTGLEPHIHEDLRHAPGFSVLKKEAADLAGPYGFITAHHSLEHMPDPLAALRQVRRLLAPGGCALVRVPVCDSFAWEHYGADWVQLDAPRHLHLFSSKSLALLAGKAGLRLERVVHDSSDFQFWGSEQYARDIPLNDPRSWSVNRRKSPFTRWEIHKFRREAARLNRLGRGDSACFFLRQAP